MSLLTYEETRPWAKAIRNVVANREMPPWHADPRYGKFANDISLTEDQIQTLVRWVDGGAMMGRAEEIPPLPKFPDGGWALGPPDYVCEFEPFEIPATGPDVFPNLSVHMNLPEDTWIQALEFKPGARRATHHIVFFRGAPTMGTAGSAAKPTGEKKNAKDAASNAILALVTTDPLAGWGSGSPPVVWPEGMGHELKKNDTLTVNMHYHPYGKAETDRTRIGLYFGKGKIKKIITGDGAYAMDIDVPPGEENQEIHAVSKIAQDSYVISYLPHMHQRGKDMILTAIYPDGNREILISVPRFHFNWMWSYYLAEPKFLPKGTVIDVVAHHDNSSKNPRNSDPSKRVRYGEESSDEMMIGGFSTVPAQGVRPPLPNPYALIADFLEQEKGRENLYKIMFNFGGLKVPSVIELSRGGKGTWYSPQGSQVIHYLSEEVRWEGNNFRFDLKIGAIGAFRFSGELAEDGSIKGSMTTDNVLGPGGSRDPLMVEFEGKRVGPALQTAEAK